MARLLLALDKGFATAAAEVIASTERISGSGGIHASLLIESVENGSLVIRMRAALNWVGLAVVAGVLGNAADRAVLNMMEQLHAARATVQETGAAAEICRAASAFGPGATVSLEAALSDGRSAKLELAPGTRLQWEHSEAGAKASIERRLRQAGARQRTAGSVFDEAGNTGDR